MNKQVDATSFLDKIFPEIKQGFFSTFFYVRFCMKDMEELREYTKKHRILSFDADPDTVYVSIDDKDEMKTVMKLTLTDLINNLLREDKNYILATLGN